jgi:hypothetical protein
MPRRDDIRKILIIGSGPIIIGQACESDYSCRQHAGREDQHARRFPRGSPRTGRGHSDLRSLQQYHAGIVG